MESEEEEEEDDEEEEEESSPEKKLVYQYTVHGQRATCHFVIWYW